jgi:hypothetical protein
LSRTFPLRAADTPCSVCRLINKLMSVEIYFRCFFIYLVARAPGLIIRLGDENSLTLMWSVEIYFDVSPTISTSTTTWEGLPPVHFTVPGLFCFLCPLHLSLCAMVACGGASRGPLGHPGQSQRLCLSLLDPSLLKLPQNTVRRAGHRGGDG